MIELWLLIADWVNELLKHLLIRARTAGSVVVKTFWGAPDGAFDVMSAYHRSMSWATYQCTKLCLLALPCGLVYARISLSRLLQMQWKSH